MIDHAEFGRTAPKHRTALTMDMHLASAEGAVTEVSQGWYERWDTDLRLAALRSLGRLREQIGTLMDQLAEPASHQLQRDVCGHRMSYPTGAVTTCILPGIHNRFDLDHEDQHGTRARVLVSWATIQEARALERGEPG